MKIKLFGKNKEVVSKNVKSLLKELNINIETVLVVKNGEIVLSDEKYSDKDDIRIIKVISGG
jgi:sulfur carrier protein